MKRVSPPPEDEPLGAADLVVVLVLTLATPALGDPPPHAAVTRARPRTTGATRINRRRPGLTKADASMPRRRRFTGTR
jgi:hypothetical protein